MELLTKGQKIIWDSGFGYELGFFEKYCEGTENAECFYNITTGSTPGSAMDYSSNVIPFTEEKLKEVQEKYD